MTSDQRPRFAALHARDQLFLMPNAFDVGSARLLAVLGFEAIATTSAGFAWTIGKDDQQVTREELVVHVAALTAAVDLPVSVDSERCFPEAPGGVARTIALLAEAGAAGCSIEDYDPATGQIEPLAVAAERVAVAAEAARAVGMTLTARAERHLYGTGDLEDTIARLRAFRAAGADCLYAPGLVDADEIAAVVAAVGAPVNVLALPAAPPIPRLAELGVRRVSVGSLLTDAAYGALVAGARELLETGTSTYARSGMPSDVRARAFGS